EVIAMDGFTGCNTAAVVELKPEVAVGMDPCHTVRLAWQALEECRRRIELETVGNVVRPGEPLYSARRTLSTGSDLLTAKRQQRISALFAGDEHVQVEATWAVYQAVLGAYRCPDRAVGKLRMQDLITAIS